MGKDWSRLAIEFASWCTTLGRQQAGSLTSKAQLPPAGARFLIEGAAWPPGTTKGIRFRFCRRDPQLIDSWDLPSHGLDLLSGHQKTTIGSCVLGWGAKPAARNFVLVGLPISAI